MEQFIPRGMLVAVGRVVARDALLFAALVWLALPRAATAQSAILADSSATTAHSVEYTLLVAPEQPDRRGATRHELHANIQGAFNEFGVQIMSPRYEADPETPKIVARSRWFEAPARPKAAEERVDAI